MADVANALNALRPSRSDSGGVITPESPESVILSPNIKEAMDRILPKSASQLLQQGLSFEQRLTQGSQNMPSAEPNTLHCSLSSKPDVTYPVKTVGLFTPASDSPPSLLASDQPADPEPVTHFDKLNGSTKDCSSSKKISKLHISRADLDTITSASDLFDNDNSLDVSSDPEDMTRCFSSVYRDKRKHKKKRKRVKNSPERNDSWEKNNVSEEDKSPADMSQNFVSALGHLETNLKSLTQPLSSRNNDIQETLPVSSFDTKHLNNGCVDKRNYIHDCQNSISMVRPSPENGFNKEFAIGNEEVSNISTSSSKENALSQRKHSGQRLPRPRRLDYNIITYKNKIKKTFLPCFVVLKDCVSVPVQKVSNSCFDLSSSILPLSTRVQHLMYLCSRGSFECKKRQKMGVIIVDDPVYKNIFEENVLPDISDEEFESALSRRSLRKRDKNISYVEPSEDDIIDEYSRKRSRSKVKDAVSDHDSSDTSRENKRKKTQNKTDVESTVEGSTEKPAEQPAGKEKVATPKEIVVFPSTPIVKWPNFFLTKNNVQQQSSSSEKRQKSKSAVMKNNITLPFDWGKVPPVLEMNKNITAVDLSKNPAPASSRISVLPAPKQLGPFPPLPPTSVPVFSIHPSGLPTIATAVSTSVVPSISTVPNALLRPPAHHKPPQYCVMKVDGKDVLLQLVPSGNPVGTTMLLPAGKKILLPDPAVSSMSPPLLSTPLRPAAPVSTQTITVPLTPAAQSNTVQSSSISNLLGLTLVNRGVSFNTTTSLPLAGFPVISFSGVGGFNSPITARPSFTSGMLLTQPSASITTTASLVNLTPSSLVAGVTSSVIKITSSTSCAPTPSLTTMAAPISKTFRHNIAAAVRPGMRAVVPNQTSSLRSIRIFVPGCTTSGTPGRFATLGSVATGSPLTRLSASSDLLPQRKCSADQGLTAEQKAAKRRKLEKKYPLPPGVVIKTEPLEDLPSSPSVSTTGRSLLNPNIQLVSSVSRPGTTVRIIAPSLANALSSRGIIRGNHNIIYRASTDGNHTVLVPTSLGQLTSASITPSSSVIVSTAVTAATTTSASLSSPGNTTVMTSTSTQNSYKQINSSPLVSVSQAAPLIRNPSPAIWSPASSLCSDKSSSETSGIYSSSPPAAPASNLGKPHLPTSGRLLTADSQEEFKTSLQKLKELVKKQEAVGLQGERLEKLRELLLKKEMEYESMKKQFETESNSSSSGMFNNVNAVNDTAVKNHSSYPFSLLLVFFVVFNIMMVLLIWCHLLLYQTDLLWYKRT
ncbi:hypothetical protein Btru_056024 [Bulinus truncatus]|nr:hypothetical protein Btru_056024 [Bulinus truncatus]